MKVRNAPLLKALYTIQIRCPYADSSTGRMDTGGHVCIQEPNCDSVVNNGQLGKNFKMSDLKLG
jgi:hypothetical protein